MNALLYFLVAVSAAALTTRAWLADREEPARQAFGALGWMVAVAFAAFALSLLPGLGGLRIVYMLTGMGIPVCALWAIDRLFTPSGGRVAPELVPLALVTVVLAPLLTGLHEAFYAAVPRASPPEVVAGFFAFGSFGLVFRRLWRAHEQAALEVEKVRLRYLLVVVAIAVAFAILEHLARNLGAPVDPTELTLATRGVALQGAVPPLSALFTGLALYLLYHTVVSYRLLDLHELFARLATLLALSLVLVLVDGLTFLWVGTFTRYPLHSTFQIFLASLVFLAAYDPLRVEVAWGASRLFNPRGQQLADTITELGRRLPTTLTTQSLVDMLLAGLQASGRAPVSALYLWDARMDAFNCVGAKGHPTAPLQAVATHPFTDGFAKGEPWISGAIARRRGRTDPAQAEIHALLDRMNADLALPLAKGEVVLGWLTVRDETWSDGYSVDEMQRLASLATLCAVVLSNIHDFQALEEEHRLAALGAMAAGLAHEIRNPLAGLTGAAQYLQHEDLSDESKEMLQVIVDEAHRLDIVVSQFLDYARPFELRRAPDHVNAIAAHALTLLRAQGLPPGVALHEELAGDLPRISLDAPRITQVLINLLRNAVQAMPSGGTLTVTTRRRSSRSGQPLIEIAVADTGVGILPANLGKLFVPFFTTKQDGTGLGLAICQRIVTAHGGELDVQSEPGAGSTFLIRLPVPPTPTERPQDG